MFQNPMMELLSKQLPNQQNSSQTIPGASPNQMAQIMNLVNQSGGNPQKAFYELAKLRGVDPQAVINMAKNLFPWFYGFKI